LVSLGYFFCKNKAPPQYFRLFKGLILKGCRVIRPSLVIEYCPTIFNGIKFDYIIIFKTIKIYFMTIHFKSKFYILLGTLVMFSSIAKTQNYPEIKEEVKSFDEVLADILNFHPMADSQRLKVLSKAVKTQSTIYLPIEIDDSVNIALNDMKKIKKQYDNYRYLAGTLPPCDEKAQAWKDCDKATFEYHTKTLIIKRAYEKRPQIFEQSLPIIRLAFKQISKECDSIRANPNPDLKKVLKEIQQPNLEIHSFSEFISEIESKGAVVSSSGYKSLDEDTMTKEEKDKIRAYFKADREANHLVMAEMIIEQCKTDSKALEFIETLKKNDINIAKYIYTKRQQKIPDSKILGEIKLFLDEKIEMIMIKKVYSR
jgi:hypothetical protein